MVILKFSIFDGSFLGKKGSAHFEILISFILFVGFTLFLLFTLEPTKQDLLEESILFNIQDTFFNNATTNLTYVLVDTTGKNCPGNNWEKSGRLCRPNELGWSEEAIWASAGRGCLFYVYTSSEFDGVGSSDLDTEDSAQSDKCDRNNDNKNYSMGYIYRLEVLSNNSLQTFKDEYYRDYNASKTRFGVPQVVDFAIDFNASNEEYDLDKAIPDEAQVIAGTYRKKVLYADGNLTNQDFIIRVW